MKTKVKTINYKQLLFYYDLMINSYKKDFVAILNTLWIEITIKDIETAPTNIKGDLAFPCFKLSKEFKKAPNKIAQELVEKSKNKQLINVGPYINFIIDQNTIAQKVIEEITKKKASFWKGKSTNKKLLIEWRQPNTHKAFHIGHIRNVIVGEAISRILEFAGNEVIKTCYPWDIWAHVAKWIWYYTKFYEWTLPKENFTKWAGQLYTIATQKVEENPEIFKEEINEIHKRLEENDTKLTAIWKETRELCLTDMNKIFQELGTTHLDRWYFESEVEKPWIKKVQELVDKGIATLSQWATVIDLEEYKLGIFLLLKSNGASLYSTKDIWLAFLKKQEYPDYDVSLYIVGSEQEHHFQQLFKTLEIMGFEHNKLKHLSYGLVDLKDGKMSSRAGNVILYEDFRDELLEKANELIKERNIDEATKKTIAHDVTFAAMKYAMLLQDTEKKIIFDKEQALSFVGETGPYIQYTYARCNSILKQAQYKITDEISRNKLDTEEEKQILVYLAQFNEAIQKAASEYKPNYIARYVLELSKLFNNYYQKHKVIQDTDKELETARLSLLFCVQQTLHNGLSLLGINTPKVM